MKKAMKVTSEVIGVIVILKIVQEWVTTNLSLAGLAMEKHNLDPSKDWKWVKGRYSIPRTKQEAKYRMALIDEYLEMLKHGLECFRHPERIGEK